ncbi:MAG: dephospho-CoA kinase [Rhodobacteraceae bacterium]|nr:dephospho-CoA kinase [Paracoccaceae bacterium]
MSFALGLTGSIGMGKSTTAGMFADLGCDVWDADAAVHRLYGVGGLAVAPLGDQFPSAIIDNAVSRDALKRIIAETPDSLKVIEQVVHPLLARDRAEFRKSARSDILVFDIPLLYETGGDSLMDAVVVVSVSGEIQDSRVMERETMTPAQFQQIKKNQMPDAEKRARADYVIITDAIDHARQQVQNIIKEIKSRGGYA